MTPHEDANKVTQSNSLEADDERFWQCSEALTDAPPLPPDAPSALARLGPSPFPKSGFPFLGFLDTVYEHVAEHVPSKAT